MSLFVGREEELRRIERRVVSDPHTRSIVEGDPGVGKTSFVNRVKADAAALSVATYEHPVRITQETTLATFVADVLRTIVRIRSAADRQRTGKVLEADRALARGRGDAWRVGVGAGRGGRPDPDVRSAAGAAGSALRAPRRGASAGDGELGRPVLLHVNNLENLSGTRTRETALLLRDLRDYLLLPGAHWVFVGATGIEDDVFRVYDQVGGIFPAADVLRPLTPAEIEQLLERRYDYLRIDGRPLVEPIVPRDAAGLYALYQGDLRNFLRLLSDAADRILGVRSVAPMAQAEVLRHAAVDYQRQFRSRVSVNDFEHLARLMAATRAPTPSSGSATRRDC